MTETTTRTTVAFVIKRHGAWLIQFVGDQPGDSPEDDNFDAASSLAVAKRLAKEGARLYAHNFRWVEDAGINGWRLEGVEEEGWRE